MVQNTITLDLVISFLNELLNRDRTAISTLIETRIPINDALVRHSTLQHTRNYLTTKPEIGLLGIINGMFGTLEGGPRNGWGPITARFDEHDNCLGFFKTENK
jgi:hypothetical protein